VKKKEAKKMARHFSPKQHFRGLQYGYRSGLEETTAADLKARGAEGMEYEKHKIRYTKPFKPSTYTPDFAVPLQEKTCPICNGSGFEDEIQDGGKSYITWKCDCCNGRGKVIPLLVIETKGRFVVEDRQKHLLVKEQHPEHDIRFLFSNSRNKIAKGSKVTYADWCNKCGFKYADKVIPDEWLREIKKALAK
jgi:DnaJ-class molecular chaperone